QLFDAECRRLIGEADIAFRIAVTTLRDFTAPHFEPNAQPPSNALTEEMIELRRNVIAAVSNMNDLREALIHWFDDPKHLLAMQPPSLLAPHILPPHVICS